MLPSVNRKKNPANLNEASVPPSLFADNSEILVSRTSVFLLISQGLCSE